MTCLSTTARPARPLVSVSSDGVQGDERSIRPAISADGRYVAFWSPSTNLVSGDTNGWDDVFVHDRQTGETSRVSVSSEGAQGNAPSRLPDISADGRFVAFDSSASNLILGESSRIGPDIFVHDRQTRETTLISVSSEGILGNRSSTQPSISADGRIVTFHSPATNLVSEDTNEEDDIFVHDRQTGETTRVSISSAGGQASGGSFSINSPALSTNGRFVAFESDTINLINGDTNGVRDVFIHDRETKVTMRVSIDSNGAQVNARSINPALSADGRFVAFYSEATNLVASDTNGEGDFFVHDRGEVLSDELTTIISSVFPFGRAVRVGNLATAFYTIENTGAVTAIGCMIAPLDEVPGADFLYAPVDPVTSVIIGETNSPVDIPAGIAQKFNITFVPSIPIAPIDVQFEVVCTNTPSASITPGVNTLLLSASSTSVSDIVALTSAPNDQVTLPSSTATGAFLIASLNLGASDEITMSADTGNTSLPLNLLVCEFDASIGNCLAVPSSTTTRRINSGEITFYAVFVVGQGTSIPLNPATNRVFARFHDSDDVVRGMTSIGVQVP